MMKNEKVLATVDIDPLWDARNDLTTIVGILGVALYLAKPDEEDPVKEDIITVLIVVHEKLAEIRDAIHEAIREGRVHKEEATAQGKC